MRFYESSLVPVLVFLGLRSYVLSVETTCATQRGLVSETEGDNMTSQAGHHGGGSQLYPNQIKVAGENVLSRLRALFQILSSICFRWEILLLYSMTFVQLIHAHGEELTGICKLMDPLIVWDRSLCPCSSTEQLPKRPMNVCIPLVHINAENHSPDPLGTPSPSMANGKVLMMVLVVIGGVGGIGLAARMLYKRWRAFTEADINVGLMREPAVPRRSDPTFEIHPSLE